MFLAPRRVKICLFPILSVVPTVKLITSASLPIYIIQTSGITAKLFCYLFYLFVFFIYKLIHFSVADENWLCTSQLWCICSVWQCMPNTLRWGSRMSVGVELILLLISSVLHALSIVSPKC